MSYQFMATLLVVNAIVAVATATLLFAALPNRIKLALLQKHRLLDCWLGLLLVVVLVLLPTNLLLWFVNSQLIPVPLAVEAVRQFDFDPEKWKDGLADTQRQYDDWYTERGGTVESARAVQRVLWETWPIIVLGGATLLVIGWVALSRFYARLLRDLASDAARPGWEEVIEDLLLEAESKHGERGDSSHHDHRHRKRRGRR